MAELGSFSSRAHAEMAAGMLDARGIPAWVLGDDAGGAFPHVSLGMRGYRVGVPDDRADEARDLLDATDDLDGEPVAPRRRASPPWVTVGRVVLAVLVAAIVLTLVVNGVDDVLGVS